MVDPEQQARETIDDLLEKAGWTLQDKQEFDRNASLGVAVREFHMPEGFCDYLLIVEGRAAGVIEAKRAGTTLSTVAEQSARYANALPEHLARWDEQLIYSYESTGTETYFSNRRDPKPRSRRLFAFHRPETLHEWLQQPDTLRGRLQQLPPLEKTGLRDCQIDAIKGLEQSLADDRPRALIQMATGAGKTFTACTFSHRLIKHGGARRILFLVDRNNLGTQTHKEFQNFHPAASANRFTDTYIVQQLQAHRIDPDAKVVITTIQRLYSLLRGRDPDAVDDEQSAFEQGDGADANAIPPLEYNPDIPVETFDFIITDECHRSIYGLWRQVLDYFDAFLIGLTATPSKHTLAFFNQNLVAEYPYEQSVADGVNVGYEIFRIRTRVSEKGGTIEAGDSGFEVPVRDKRTRELRYQSLDDDLDYTGKDLDRSVVNPNQIRTILQTYRDRVFTELFPGRSGDWLPKTLVFAKDDNHAEEIVHIAREVFGEGNDFAKKITYRGDDDPKSLINAFRNDPMPRIAVTVDMVATGTDIKPVEAVLFMRDVQSEGYYEQMKGRGVRTIPDADLKQVTPDARTKTRFVLVDAVGVTETRKNASQPLERKRNLSFEKLMNQIAMGRRDEDALSSLAGRLAALDKKLDNEDREHIRDTAGHSPTELATQLLTAIDPDSQDQAVREQHGENATAEQRRQTIEQLQNDACRPFDKPDTRQLLTGIKKKTDIVIDKVTPDETVDARFDVKQAEATVTSFKQFMADNQNELTALQILYNQPAGQQKLTYDAIRELVQAMAGPPQYLTTANVWQAYKRIEAAHVRGAPVDEQLTEVVSLVRFALGQTDQLEPFNTVIERRFNLWMGREKKAGRDYSDEQQAWLNAIARHIAANAEITPQDFMQAPDLTDKGGLIKAREVLGNDLNDLLDDLNMALVA